MQPNGDLDFNIILNIKKTHFKSGFFFSLFFLIYKKTNKKFMATQSRIGWRPYVNLSTATYLVDTYSGSTAVYSLRKVNSTYTGPAIRVRRSSDNTESDISFNSNGDLNQTTLLSFVGVKNYLNYSEEFDNAWWLKWNVSVTANTTTAPDGTMTADLLSETTASGTHTLYKSNSYALYAYPEMIAGFSWNFSVYIKKGPGTNAPNKIALTNSYGGVASDTILVSYDMSTGNSQLITNGGFLNSGCTMSSVGNGWWRCFMWGTSTGQYWQRPDVVKFIDNGNRLYDAYVGNTQSNIYIWGMQLTQGTASSTYSKSSASISGTGYVTTWYDQSGSARHSTQITASAQPYIVSNGSLILRSGKPAIYFDGWDDTLRLSTPLPVSDITTLFTVAFANYENSSNDIVFGRRGAASYRFGGGNNLINSLCITRAESADYIYASTPASTTGLNTLAVFHNHHAFGNYDGLNRTRIYSNGVWRNDGNSFGQSGFSQVEYIGSGGDCQFFKNTIQELVFYPSNQLNNRIAIENNINSYYSLWDRTAVVSNGLVLNLDASDINSYYKTGTEWFNIAATSSIIKGTLVNGPVFSTANGGVINFDGVNDYVDCGNSSAFNQTNALTLSTWAKINSFASTNTLIGKQWCYGNQYSYSLAIDTQGKLQFYYSLDGGYCGGTFASYISSNPISTNTWYNIVLSFTNTSVKLYLNGQLISGIQTGINTSLYVSNSPVLLGIYRNLSGTYSDALNGSMGSVKIYNRSLSDTEILQNFNVTKSRFGL